ncbi:MAG: 23S rRNA (adenine(1618)-N(6))-methyltransferase RlmF [Candidatus Methylopumilus sp.]|jgi:23S rRNA (adenine1618-N6)-methyltransferase|nr:23S rRNA (adenine(1618)-N(6))-methyltransferase RlmF [Candidatus Methylopumilus sp.]
MHPKNKHQGRYDLVGLSISNPKLKAFVKPNAYNDLSIDFANPKAVKALNQALLAKDYQIAEWDIPDHFLCPPIPGRADYIHYLADLIDADKSKKMTGLDIGVGANAIYPLIGHREYGWDFIGADINANAIKNAQAIVDANGLNNCIQFRLQSHEHQILKGIIQADDAFDFTMCNPPFHASLEDAQAVTQRKIYSLAKNAGKQLTKTINAKLNFGGQGAELFCKGGELGFIERMIKESALYKNQCRWFTTLVSKASNLPKIERSLKAIAAKKIKIVEMSQGQKQSRFVAWSYVN